jgi:hypothetical protein
MMAHILFPSFFVILCNDFPSPVYVSTMMQILQSSKPVLDFNVTMFSNLQFGTGLFLSVLDFPSAN